MRRSIALALVSLTVAAEPIAACICLNPLTVRKARRDADAVFVADVVEVRPVACSAEPDRCSNAAYAELDVTRSWKGVQEDSRQLTVFLPDPEACGYALEQGGTYLIYAGAEPPRNWGSAFGSPAHPDLLSVSSCSRTTPVTDAVHDLEKLKKPEWSE